MMTCDDDVPVQLVSDALGHGADGAVQPQDLLPNGRS